MAAALARQPLEPEGRSGGRALERRRRETARAMGNEWRRASEGKDARERAPERRAQGAPPQDTCRRLPISSASCAERRISEFLRNIPSPSMFLIKAARDFAAPMGARETKA